MTDYFEKALRDRYLLLKLLAWFEDEPVNSVSDHALQLSWALNERCQDVNY